MAVQELRFHLTCCPNLWDHLTLARETQSRVQFGDREAHHDCIATLSAQRDTSALWQDRVKSGAEAGPRVEEDLEYRLIEEEFTMDLSRMQGAIRDLLASLQSMRIQAGSRLIESETLGLPLIAQQRYFLLLRRATNGDGYSLGRPLFQ